MKTGIAAMLAATERSLSGIKPGNTSFWWLITSDEEGEAEYGSQWIYSHLKQQGIMIDHCIVGEPTAAKYTGDTIKIGRRGSLSVSISITGKQGHVAYPQSAINAIHKSAKIINSLTDYQWDEGSPDFPGTSLQITHIDSGKFTDNVVPGECEIQLNIRYSHLYSEHTLKAHVAKLIHSIDCSAQISWSRPCEAYLSRPRETHCLISHTEQAIYRATGRYPVLSSSGGTSDGRFFANQQTQVVEVGVPNETIHQVNESIHLSDLMTLEDIFTDLVTQLVASEKQYIDLPPNLSNR
jgi:succinyl-diaminopimelate desuccinylase